MAIAFVRGNSTSASSGFTITLPSNDAGNLIIVGVESTASSTDTPTDTASNTYTLIQNNVSGGWYFKLWYAKNCNASASTNTITTSSGGGFSRNTVYEFSGLDTTTPLRTSNQNSASNNSVTAGALVTVSGDLIIGYVFSNGGTLSAGTGYTIPITPADVFAAMEYKVTSSTSENPAMGNTGSAQWTAISAAFIPASGGGFTAAFRKTLSGAGTGVGKRQAMGWG